MPKHIQGNWRWCHKCEGLWFNGHATKGVCPAGGVHELTGSGNYALIDTFPGGARQTNWRWCSKCEGLWFAGNVGKGPCPAGGDHTQAGSGDYAIVHNTPSVPEQNDWRWCTKCQGMWFNGHVTKGVCKAGGAHSSAGSGDYRIAQVPENIQVHFKVLTAPSRFTVDEMLESMRQVYNAVGIGVDLISTENLNLPALNDCDVGTCSGVPTAEQVSLFSNRNNVGGNDVVIYFVRSTVPAFNGCATHPAGQPGAVVASIASQWTVGHEIGHVLGLPHCDTAAAPLFDRLMTGQGTDNITNPPPDVIASEVSTMKSSALTVAV